MPNYIHKNDIFLSWNLYFIDYKSNKCLKDYNKKKYLIFENILMYLDLLTYTSISIYLCTNKCTYIKYIQESTLTCQSI